jgi:KTSC domain
MSRLRVNVEDSGNIRSFTYDHPTETLQIDFHRGSYLYFDVPKEIVVGMMGSESKGKYFQEFIKGKFETLAGCFPSETE